MVREIAEADATGVIADIYADVRRLYATPYVSSIHRHLATRPGVLEWAWGAVAPLFRSGEAQEAGWSIARRHRLPPLAPIPQSALDAWGVAAPDVARVQIACQSFTRVAPVNLMLGALVAGVLGGSGRPVMGGGHDAAPAWSPPPMLPDPPPMLDEAALPPATRDVLGHFRSGSGETAFVPGLYRMLAHWPGLLAHLAVVLPPRLGDDAAAATTTALLAEIDAGAARLLERHARGDSGFAPPEAAEAQHILGMINVYRKTSPELILGGRLVLEALPHGTP